MKKLFSLIVSAVMVLSLHAQTTTSSINGKVTDEKGDALVGATVIAVHTPRVRSTAPSPTPTVVTTSRVCVRAVPTPSPSRS